MQSIFQEVIIPLFFFAILVIGSVLILRHAWKSRDETFQILSGVIYLGEYSKEEKIHKIRNSGTRAVLGIIWAFTIATGLFGIWSNVTAPLLISLSVCLTIGCAISMIKRKYCNISLGICSIYFGYLCLLAAFKLGYYHFDISYWWFVMAIILIATFVFGTIILMYGFPICVTVCLIVIVLLSKSTAPHFSPKTSDLLSP